MKVNTKPKKTTYAASTVAKLKHYIKALENAVKAAMDDKVWLHNERRRLENELQVLRGVQERARLCFHYPEGVTNFERAAFEYIAHGPRGEDPKRNGIHPFTRWGMETPEARVARREAEAQKAGEHYDWHSDYVSMD